MKEVALALYLLIATVYAQNCSALNAVVEVSYGGHYRQYLQDARPLSDVVSLFVQHTNNVDFNNMHVNEKSSFLARAVLIVPNQEVFDGKVTQMVIDEKSAQRFLQPADANVDTIAKHSVLFGISNVIQIPDFYDKDKRAAFTIVNVLVPTPNNVSSINFVVVDGDGSASNVNDTFGAVMYQPSTAEENIYDKNGTVVGKQDKSDLLAGNVNMTTIDYDSISHQKILATRLLSAKKSDKSVVVDFVVLLNSQDSIKLTSYQVTATQVGKMSPVVDTKILWQNVIIPRVNTVTSRGAIIQVDNNQIYIAASLTPDQKAAILAVHGITLEFSENQKSASFLLRVDPATGKVTFATNLAISSVPHTLTDEGYPADLVVNNNTVYVASNTIDIPTHTSTEPTAALQSYVTRVIFNGDQAFKVVQSLSSIIDDRDRKGKSEEDIKKLRFVAYSVAFSMDGNKDKVLAGGSVGDYTTPWAIGGRLGLLSLNPDPKGAANLIYGLEVGYSGSNAVKIAKRAAVPSGGHVVQLGLLLSGPTTKAPPNPVDDKFRNVKAGFWLTDCSPPDFKIQQAFTILFYVLFGVIAFSMLTAVITFTVKGIYMYRKGRETEETRSLLMS
jgi:hypothetical protein